VQVTLANALIKDKLRTRVHLRAIQSFCLAQLA